MIIKNRHLLNVKESDIVHDTIILPPEVLYIEWRVFQDLPITHILLPQNVKSVHAQAFFHCTKLTSIIFANPNCTLSDATFDLCQSLESIILPRDLKVLPIYTFRDCKQLKEIIIPDSVRELTLEQFLNCEKLQKIQWRDHMYSYADLQTYIRF